MKYNLIQIRYVPQDKVWASSISHQPEDRVIRQRDRGGHDWNNWNGSQSGFLLLPATKSKKEGFEALKAGMIAYREKMISEWQEDIVNIRALKVPPLR